LYHSSSLVRKIVAPALRVIELFEIPCAVIVYAPSSVVALVWVAVFGCPLCSQFAKRSAS